MQQCVCILTAGRGTRMGALGDNINKALLPINQKAAISWIIEKFPSETHFVIALGHKGNQVREFLALTYPAKAFDFVEVENFDGTGSGPGKSLLACHDHLQRPFYFVSCDTLWNGPIEWGRDHDWLAVATVPDTDTDMYCNVKIQGEKAVGLKDKSFVASQEYKAFTGLCFILNFNSFWDGLSHPTLIADEHQISNGIQALIDNHEVGIQEIEWIDIGEEKKYRAALALFENYDFAKQSEHLYICGRHVVKYFEDQSVASKRVQKARMNPHVFPAVSYLEGNFYSYKFITGKTLYKENNNQVFRRLLDWLDEALWRDVDVDQATFTAVCSKFYFDKTFSRLQAFDMKYPGFDQECIINGQLTPSARSLLGLVDWELLSNGLPSFIHGDLQFDNIIYDPQSKKFTLIDWRQDFAGKVEYGDRYYDFAKLLGGMILNYDLIKMALMDFKEDGNEIHFDFAQRNSGNMFRGTLSSFLGRKGYDFSRVELLVGIIFINMSPLHHYPFDKLLSCLGRQTMNSALKT